MFGDWLLLLAAGVLAGLINAVASGGSFFTYPALLLTGLSPIQAATTTLVALVPGNLAAIGPHRDELERHRGRWTTLLAVTVVGSAAGIALLFATGADGFEAAVPWLILLATGLFWFSPRLRAWAEQAAPGLINGTSGLVVLLVLSAYLTFFGSGVGYLFFAMFTVRGFDGFHGANTAKNVVMSVGVVMAAVAYTTVGWVVWLSAAPILIGSAAGGWLSARLARSIPLSTLRVFVLVFGLFVAGWSFVR